MLPPEVLSELRAALEAERDDLRRQIGEMGEDAGLSDDNFADSGQVAAEQGEYRVLSGALGEQLIEVEHALAKMDEGTYGLCEAEGEAIARDRLEAMPASRFCIDHA